MLYLALQPVFIRNNKTIKMPDYLGNDMRKTKDEKEAEEKDIKRKLVSSFLILLGWLWCLLGYIFY